MPERRGGERVVGTMRDSTKRWLWSVAAVGASAMALGALYTAWESRRIDRAHPPRGKFVTVDGVRLHVLDAGSGPPVLLIHGNAVAAQDWVRSGVFDALSADHRVIAPDRPGYGHSLRPGDRVWTPKAQADLLAKLLRELGAAPALVIGHSVGVQVAMRLALDHPDVVSATVLASGYYQPTWRIDSLFSGVAAIPVLGAIWRHTLALPLGKLLGGATVKAMFAPQEPPAGYEREVFELALRPLQQRAVAADGFYMLPAAFKLGRVRLPGPAFFLAGGADRIVDPWRQSARLAARAGAPFQGLRRVGHMVHHADPTLVAAVARESAAQERL